MEITMSKTKKLTISAIVIALYVVIMTITQSFSFGAIQIRLATSLYALAYIFPFLVLPLGVSNLLSNMLLGGLSIFDILGGGLVGILTALLVYCVRKYKLNITLTILPIIFIPGLIVPIWLSMILNVPYSALAVSLCLGQVIPAILGSFLIKVLKDKIGD
ncbi:MULTISPECIES: QueT transporter family protein [unclassified Clostridium]|uniref:QueT transporter family protein n=1 Tax=unclassified Clostridium TaxID=2614128 RepID=UPI001A9A9037|nr:MULTISPECIES: QueT transporter family protein [unclassified Clostridium]MBP3915558.1 QueT transporter family protein [Clostridium sp.]MEE0933345.1 QueT transporter family protein [Clostridium sp.]